MTIRSIIKTIVLLKTVIVFSQENFYTSFTIPNNLRQNANAVVRSNEQIITINDIDNMTVFEKRIITVLNKEGNDDVGAYVPYDNNVKIKELEVQVYNDFGALLKKVKKNDFKDVSAVDGGTLYSDSRVKYLEYTPISYPYTIEFISEFTTRNTAFINSFSPVNGYFVSVENSSYTLNHTENITIRKKEINFENLALEKNEQALSISYKVKGVEAMKPEEFSPSFGDLAPKVLFAAKQFSLEGVKAEVENWDDFAKWMYNDIIKDTHDLPATTINAIQNLVKDEENDIEKAKKIYQYVQDKTRYISVQVGIGGWKPFNASYVDKVGYGDCKALSNYTMSLLNAAGIKSNYCVVWRYTGGKSIEKDFASMQGNHVFLHIPTENNEDIWLECTSQKLPFGFIASSTDDRDVLVITPDGGQIKHTKKYNADDNMQLIKAKAILSDAGHVNVVVKESSKGVQYDDKYQLETLPNNITIDKMEITNDKDSIQFNETIYFNALNYSKQVGDRMLVNINVLNRNIHVPDRYRDRKLPLKIKEGFVDIDEVELKLPQGYKVESLPTGESIENKFGNYKTEIIVKDKATLLYKRQFLINDGEFPKEDYEEFRNFYKEVSKLDNSKIALIKNL